MSEFKEFIIGLAIFFLLCAVLSFTGHEPVNNTVAEIANNTTANTAPLDEDLDLSGRTLSYALFANHDKKK